MLAVSKTGSFLIVAVLIVIESEKNTIVCFVSNPPVVGAFLGITYL